MTKKKAPLEPFNTLDLALNNSIARVHSNRLPQFHVFNLSLGDLQLGLERCRICNPRDIESGRYLLAYLHRYLLQDATGSRAHLEARCLVSFQSCQRSKLLDARLLSVNLSFCRLTSDRESITFHLQTTGKSLNLHARDFEHQVRNQSLLA